MYIYIYIIIVTIVLVIVQIIMLRILLLLRIIVIMTWARGAQGGTRVRRRDQGTRGPRRAGEEREGRREVGALFTETLRHPKEETLNKPGRHGGVSLNNLIHRECLTSKLATASVLVLQRLGVRHGRELAPLLSLGADTYIYIYIYIYICMHVCTHTYIYIYRHTHTHYMHVYVLLLLFSLSLYTYI